MVLPMTATEVRARQAEMRPKITAMAAAIQERAFNALYGSSIDKVREAIKEAQPDDS